MHGENLDSFGREAVLWVRFRLVSQSCLSESMECINLRTPVNRTMKVNLPTNTTNGNNIIIILEELMNSTSFVNKNRHYYMAILLLHHIQK
jgi:hypothetical protein